MSSRTASIHETLEDYGASPDALRSFDQGDNPSLLPYVTLLNPHPRGIAQDCSALLGVYEWQGAPLMYLADQERLHDDREIRTLRRKLALRDDAPYLGLIQPGTLTVYGLSLDSKEPAHSLVPRVTTMDRHATFTYLANARPQADGKRVWITNVVLTLIADSIRALIRAGVANHEAVSLAGRALFLRFLGDRDLLPPNLLPPESDPAQLLADPRSATRTCSWLDGTFNGDLLPISKSTFDAMDDESFANLGDILRRAPGGQLHLGWQHKWNYLDFGHIPVGVLSHAYEQFMREHLPEAQRKNAGFYTPRPIAELVTRAAFQALREQKRAHSAKVLDPAVGAGVFLLAAFRHIVADRWEHDGKRPETRVLRDILYGQLVGFDVNEEALRFAALGLYLISIELDPDPEPVTKLKFELNLRDRVLFKLSSNGGSRSLGSLSPGVPVAHDNTYDLVVGNPPWTGNTRLPGWKEVAKVVRRIATARLGELTPRSLLPNECLDLPFLWRSTEWARHDGFIAFALHARLLFQQGEGMPESRLAIFRAIDVTGLVNGAELRKSAVWPNMKAPFCLLFARNRRPVIESGCRFVSPHREEALNKSGVLRCDAGNSEVVTVAELVDRPEIFKLLFRGTRLDLDILERMTATKTKRLTDYWADLFGNQARTGNGYQRLRKSSRTRKTGDGQAGCSADYLRDLHLKELTLDAMDTALVDHNRAIDFAESRLHDPRPENLFFGPLLIVHKSPPAKAQRIRTSVSERSIIFNESYYGYSAANCANGLALVKYLALVLGSRLALWWALMTSGEFGIEREVAEKKIAVDRMRIVPLENLCDSDLAAIDKLFGLVAAKRTEESWRRVDEWVARLYGLHIRDLQVIDDTLAYNLPFAACVSAAQAPPESLQEFCSTLAVELEPWRESGSGRIRVDPFFPPSGVPWAFVHVSDEARSEELPLPTGWWKVLQTADQLGAAECIHVKEPGNGVWIARLRQARYWSQSQARLLARRIVWSHLDALFGRHT